MSKKRYYLLKIIIKFGIIAGSIIGLFGISMLPSILGAIMIPGGFGLMFVSALFDYLVQKEK